MERHIMKKLIQWKNSKKKKPLIIKGTRQVGKHILFVSLAKRIIVMY